MKIQIHKSEERGRSDLEWLHSRFSFSFANYRNPRRMGFGALRVLNDDVVEPGMGFGAHEHDNMEIISIPLEGELAHKDSTGDEDVIGVGDISVMSAGTGVIHSEFNPSETNQAKFFQIWIQTKERDIEPRHDRKNFELLENALELVVSGEKSDSSLLIYQDAKIYLGKFAKGKKIKHEIGAGMGVFIMSIEGKITVEGKKLDKRDSIEISDAKEIIIEALDKSYFILIEVPME
ncbi:pirin family protein [Candidatus Micrarchaeota archaeon]|nr:pirin family protein [Candidatus Micrarchaeota archaeon]